MEYVLLLWQRRFLPFKMSTVLDVRILRTVLVLMTISIVFINCQRSYFDEIKDAMHSLKSYLHTGLDGLAKLAKTIEVVEQFVDATIDEDCEPFMCPKGIKIGGIFHTIVNYFFFIYFFLRICKGSESTT